MTSEQLVSLLLLMADLRIQITSQAAFIQALQAEVARLTPPTSAPPETPC